MTWGPSSPLDINLTDAAEHIFWMLSLALQNNINLKDTDTVEEKMIKVVEQWHKEENTGFVNGTVDLKLKDPLKKEIEGIMQIIYHSRGIF